MSRAAEGLGDALRSSAGLRDAIGSAEVHLVRRQPAEHRVGHHLVVLALVEVDGLSAGLILMCLCFTYVVGTPSPERGKFEVETMSPHPLALSQAHSV